MKTFDVRRWLVVAGACLVAGTTWAADATLFDSVPAERDAVVVINVQQVLDSQVFRALEENVNLSKLNDGLAQLEYATGFNLRRDLQKLVVGKFNGRDREDIAL